MTRVIFISGLGGSGAALLERLLGQLPGVIALGAVSHLWQRLHEDADCGCGEPWLSCGFWRSVGDAAFGGWEAIDAEAVLALRERVARLRHLPRLALRRPGPEVGEYAGYHRRVYAAASQVAGARVVVDSGGHSSLAWCLRETTLDLRVVHLVRDPRAVAHAQTGPAAQSGTARSATIGLPSARAQRPGSGAAVLIAAATALRWNAHNTALSLLSRYGTPVFRLRYEELVAQPAATLQALVRFASVGAASDLSFVGRDTVTLGPSHAAGYPPPFTVLPLPRDERWRRDLAPRQRRLVGAVCAPLLPAYGYPLRTGGRR